MPTTVSAEIVTAKSIFERPSDGYRYELLQGNLRMMSPAGGRHGRITLQVAHLLKTHSDAGKLGVVFAAETGFLIETDPDTVLAPDVAFVSRSRFESIENEIRYLPLAPELVVEVLSPSDRFSQVEAKAFAWIDAGTKLVLVVNPESETIHAYRSRKQIEVFECSESIDCSTVVPGWILSVAAAFQLY